MNDALETHPLLSLAESRTLRPEVNADHLLLLGAVLGLLLALCALVLLARWAGRRLRRWLAARGARPLDSALLALDALHPETHPADTRRCAGRMVSILRTYLQETRFQNAARREAGIPLPELLRTSTEAGLAERCEHLLLRLDRVRFAPVPVPENELQVCREEMRRLLHALGSENSSSVHASEGKR